MGQEEWRIKKRAGGGGGVRGGLGGEGPENPISVRGLGGWGGPGRRGARGGRGARVGGRGVWVPKGGSGKQKVFLALEKVPPPDFRIFGRTSRGLGSVPRGLPGRRRSRALRGGGFGLLCEYSCGWVAQRQLAMGEARSRGSLFDHSPMAPPIVHPVKSMAAGYLLGPGTLVKGGYGLSRPGGNLGYLHFFFLWGGGGGGWLL